MAKKDRFYYVKSVIIQGGAVININSRISRFIRWDTKKLAVVLSFPSFLCSSYKRRHFSLIAAWFVIKVTFSEMAREIRAQDFKCTARLDGVPISRYCTRLRECYFGTQQVRMKTVGSTSTNYRNEGKNFFFNFFTKRC